MGNDDTEALLHLEDRRCQAISGGDWASLAQLLSETLTHTHATGVTQDKATYLAHVKSHPRSTTRRGLRVRIYGDAAIMTGIHINVMPGPEATAAVTESVATQVWIREADNWRLEAFQATRAPLAG